MVLDCQLFESFLDLSLCGIFLHAHDLVIIFFLIFFGLLSLPLLLLTPTAATTSELCRHKVVLVRCSHTLQDTLQVVWEDDTKEHQD